MRRGNTCQDAYHQFDSSKGASNGEEANQGRYQNVELHATLLQRTLKYQEKYDNHLLVMPILLLQYITV